MKRCRLFKLFSFCKELMPLENEILISLYEAKKTLSTLGMEYNKIHPYPNDCILYCKEFLEANSSLVCNYSRWKLNSSNTERKGIPAKVLWYIPTILKMKCLFQNYDHAKNLIWHEEERCNTPFTPPDAKSVNEMSLAFENIITKFSCNFFFKTLTLTIKTPF